MFASTSVEGLDFPGDFELAILSKTDNNIKMMTLWTLNAIIVLHIDAEIEAEAAKMDLKSLMKKISPMSLSEVLQEVSEID